jgi:hypothetical protein
MSTRGLLDLLAAAQAQRDQVLAALAGDELHWVAWREWAAIVDKLAAGEPFRLRRGDELPAKHPARRQGRRDDLLVLREDDELGGADQPRGRAPGAPPIRVNPNPTPAQRHRAAAP